MYCHGIGQVPGAPNDQIGKGMHMIYLYLLPHISYLMAFTSASFFYFSIFYLLALGPRVLAMISTVHLAIFTIILGLTVIMRTFTNKRANLPPGPRGKFLIGNLFDLPSSGTQEWLHWLKHKNLYGAILSSSGPFNKS